MSMHRVGDGYVFVPEDTDRDLMKLLGIEEYEGYVGWFTRRQFPGAILNGAHVHSATDPHTTGVVLGSVMMYPWTPVSYFIELDSKPKHVVHAPEDDVVEDKQQ